MKKIKKIFVFLKKYWVLVFLSLVTLFLLFWKIFHSFPSPPPQATPAPPLDLQVLVPPNISGQKIPFQHKFEINDFSYPSQLPIYQGSFEKITPARAQEMAKYFNFLESPQEIEDIFLGHLLAWNSTSHALSIGLETGKVEYLLDLFNSKINQSGSLPSPTETRNSLENLLNKLKISFNFEPKWQKESFLVNNYSFTPTTDSQEADFINIGFNPSLNSYQLVGQQPYELLVSLTLGKNSEVIRFLMYSFFETFTEQDSYPLKSIEEIKRTIISEGRIVYTGKLSKTFQEPQFIRLSFDQISLAYLQEAQKDQLIQPIFILTGKGVLESKEEVEIAAYLPAITSSFLKPLSIPQDHLKEIDIPFIPFEF
ncbi:hypothetical protein ACFL0Y_01635 [Patescibacteria group bacterium]